MEFFYDGVCGFCQFSAQWLERLCVPALKVTPAWSSGHERTPAEVVAHIDECAVYQDRGGDWLLGHWGIGKCLQQAGAHRLTRAVGWFITAPGVSSLSAAVYALVARNRHRLGPLVGVRSCKRD